MREDLYNEKEKEEFKKKQLIQLKSQRNMLREDNVKIEKILKEEEEKNFKINKKYFKINTVLFFSFFIKKMTLNFLNEKKLEEKEQEAQEINRMIEDIKYKNYFNYYDKDFTDKLEGRVKEIFDEHFVELDNTKELFFSFYFFLFIF